MDNVSGIIFSLALFTIGFIMVYGAKKGWEFLVDPPESWYPFYSQSFIKKIFGKKFLFYETIIIGAMFMIVSLYSWISFFIQ